ncbi:hypothetical protein HHL19_13615 [Streptomyces sp. R302]|uniref:hypothetical protein n=1 Tax=unclassified Streptomyces TaxID=2593676 RepID=UPI00145DE8A0|nr:MULTISPECIES: hypothetical protein [unclassified Streptomyces]NML55601.1 hypothetical protein [Streptomyces sp. R301]NML79690.1 hypothetical protein [Streptomyces sp. R302]
MMRTVIGRAALGIAAAVLTVSATAGAGGGVVLAEDRCLGAPAVCGPVNGWQETPDD